MTGRQYTAKGIVVTPKGAAVLAAILAHARGERSPVTPSEFHPATIRRLIATGLIVDTSEFHPATIRRLIATGLIVDTSRRHGLELTVLGWRVAYTGEKSR